jgi:hypothetical protein
MLATTLIILIGLLALAIPVAAGLGVLGLVLSALYSKLPLSLAMGEISWATSNNFLLVAIPFFVLLGEILLALRHGRADVQRPRALDPMAARRSHAFQYRRLRHVCRHLRLERGHGRHHRHGGDGRDRKAGLFGSWAPSPQAVRSAS